MRDVAALRRRQPEDGLARDQRRAGRAPRRPPPASARRSPSSASAATTSPARLRQGRDGVHARPGHRGRRQPVLLGDRAGGRGRRARARLHAHHRLLRGGPRARARARRSALLRRRVDALLLVPASRDHGYLGRARSEGTPVVFVDRPPAGLDADCVLLDNLGGARAGRRAPARARPRADRVGRRPRRAATPPPSGSPATATRSSAAGMPVREELVRHRHARRRRTPRRPCASCSRCRRTAARPRCSPATTATRSARCARCATPRTQVALVGFDDFELADLLAAVTVVRHDSQQLGARAAAIAFARLDGGEEPPRRVVVPTELVIRGSGEVPPP